jgi:hypothetical protein
MPGPLLQTSAIVICSHFGLAKPTVPVPRVLLNGQPVVTLPGPWVVSGCPLPPPPAANGPCVTAQFLTAATRVLVTGQPVLLLDSQSVCAPTGTPLLPLLTQFRVIAT